HAAEPPLVALRAREGGDGERARELPAVRARERLHDGARLRPEAAQEAHLEARAVLRRLEVVAHAAPVAGEPRELRRFGEEGVAPRRVLVEERQSLERALGLARLLSPFRRERREP